MVGGTTPAVMARTQKSASMAPAAPSGCPVIDFVDETGTSAARAPSAILRARVSATSPAGVAVPCALT